MDEEREVTRRTYQQIAGHFAQRHWTADLSRGYALMKAELPSGAHILEVGCGPGRDIAGLRHLGFRVTGVDLSLAMLFEARARVGGDLAAGDMLHLPFSAQFDAAWLAASLLHIPKAIVPQALVELRRLLKPNGLIYISVKGGSGEVWQQDEGGRRFFAYYEAPELQNILASTGFMVFADWEKTIGKTRWLSLAARVV